VSTIASEAGSTSLFGEPAAYEGGLHEVAPGTFAWLQPNGSWGESNAGLVAGAGESLLVDTLWDVRLTTSMLGAMGEHTAAAPIKTLVNTHSDGDHWWGNQLLPDTRRFTTTASAEVMVSEADAPAALERMRRLAGRLARGLPVPGAGGETLRTFGDYIVRMLEPYDFSSVRPTPATDTFGGRLSFDVGGRAVELIEVGPAHTAGDLIVWLPDVRVVFAADVAFVGSTPAIWAGPVSNWLRALELIADLDPAVVVPGHGPLCGIEELERVASYLRWLEAAARRRSAAGASSYRVAEELALSDEFRNHDWAAWLAPERIVINCHTLWREEHEKPPVGALGRMRIFAHVSRLAERLSRR
jgi:glyoxylase-like metal-dependent hydrolase (beta-lactamase superfamily II)